MARRADHTREELMELAIVKGVGLIASHGFSAFSARKLATAMGYTVGTLYNVFGNYDNMLLHINARTLDMWFTDITAALKKNHKGNQLHVIAKAYITFSRTYYEQWLALFEYHLSEGAALPDWYKAKLAGFFDTTEKVLLPQVGGNARRAHQAARVLWAGIHGICVLSLSGKLDLVAADSAETLSLSLIDNYMAGLMA